jgi:hypothetical protein
MTNDPNPQRRANRLAKVTAIRDWLLAQSGIALNEVERLRGAAVTVDNRVANDDLWAAIAEKAGQHVPSVESRQMIADSMRDLADAAEKAAADPDPFLALLRNGAEREDIVLLRNGDQHHGRLNEDGSFTFTKFVGNVPSEVTVPASDHHGKVGAEGTHRTILHVVR